MRTMTRHGEEWQWVVVHVAGNGDWRYDVYQDRAAAYEGRARRGNAPLDSAYRVAKIKTACHPGASGIWGSGPAPAGEPEREKEG